jgi:predicted HAD superfamily phosphohydrolase
MLDLIFYRTKDLAPQYVQVSESLYEWLARSDFSKIGGSEPTRLELEGETVELPLVALAKETRQGLMQFLRDQIVLETEGVLQQLDTVFSKDIYQEVTYRLRKLQELRKCIEDQSYAYLQRA